MNCRTKSTPSRRRRVHPAPVVKALLDAFACLCNSPDTTEPNTVTKTSNYTKTTRRRTTVASHMSTHSTPPRLLDIQSSWSSILRTSTEELDSDDEDDTAYYSYSPVAVSPTAYENRHHHHHQQQQQPTRYVTSTGCTNIMSPPHVSTTRHDTVAFLPVRADQPQKPSKEHHFRFDISPPPPPRRQDRADHANDNGSAMCLFRPISQDDPEDDESQQQQEHDGGVNVPIQQDTHSCSSYQSFHVAVMSEEDEASSIYLDEESSVTSSSSTTMVSRTSTRSFTRKEASATSTVTSNSSSSSKSTSNVDRRSDATASSTSTGQELQWLAHRAKLTTSF